MDNDLVIKLQLEQSLGSCILMDNRGAGLLEDFSLDDFCSLPLKAIVGCARQKGKVDPVLAWKWAKENGIDVKVSDISALLLSCVSATNTEEYVRALKEASYRIGVKAITRDVEGMILEGIEPEKISEEVIARRNALDNKFSGGRQSGDLLEAVNELMASIEEGRDNSQTLVPTNFKELDNMHGGGFLPNELIVLAARPSCGKTALALQIAIDCGVRVCLFSFEMNKRQLAVRLLANISGRNTKIAGRNPSMLSAYDRECMLSANDLMRVAAERIAVYDEPDQTVATIRSIARKETGLGAKLIVIDYLQLITSTDKTESREREVANISRSLKNLSKELNVPIIVLAQVNRSCEAENRVPRLSDLRESGAIEQDANSVIFLHDTGTKTDDRYKIITMIVAKGRDVGTGYAKLYFNADKQRFYSMEG